MGSLKTQTLSCRRICRCHCLRVCAEPSGPDARQKTSVVQVDLRRPWNQERLSKHNISRHSCVPCDLLQGHFRYFDFPPCATTHCNKSLAADLWPQLHMTQLDGEKKNPNTFVNFRPWQLVNSRNTHAPLQCVSYFRKSSDMCVRWGAAAALWINKQELALIWHCRINLLPEGSRGRTTDLHNCNFMILDFCAFSSSTTIAEITLQTK